MHLRRRTVPALIFLHANAPSAVLLSHFLYQTDRQGLPDKSVDRDIPIVLYSNPGMLLISQIAVKRNPTEDISKKATSFCV